MIMLTISKVAKLRTRPVYDEDKAWVAMSYLWDEFGLNFASLPPLTGTTWEDLHSR